MGPKPLEIFVIAEQFYWAGVMAARVPYEVAAGTPHYSEIGRDLPNMAAASTACLAFSLELYFKCLIRMGNKPPETGHDLVKLFKKIGVRHQAAIKKYFYQNLEHLQAHLERAYAESGRPMPKIDFDFVLSASKDVFSIMRYLYEKGMALDTGWLASEILEGARQTILAKHPDWIRARQASLLAEIIVQPRPTFPTR